MQVKTFGTLVSSTLCNNSSVQVGCLTAERLGVNVTWKLQLGDISVASLPDLHSIGMFICAAALTKVGSLIGPQIPPHEETGAGVVSSHNDIGRIVSSSWEELVVC